MQKTGVVDRLKEKFGFIRQDEGNDLFFMVGHCTAFGGLPEIGTRVKYTMSTDRKFGKPMATNLQPLDERDLLPPKPKRPPLRAPDLTEINIAADNISGKAIRTPLVRLNWQSLLPNVEIYLKLENLQPIGSDKVRPAANAIANIVDKEALEDHGVCTASTGNFGQGLASICKKKGIQCTVIVPDDTPESKLSEIRRNGAMVIKVPYEDWWEIIETHDCPRAPKGSIFIHPGAEQSVIAGNATIALEICQDLPEVDCIVVPYGTGALCAGIACGVRALGDHYKNCKIMGCEPATASPFALSKLCGEARKFVDWEPSFVDGCGGKALVKEVWKLAKDKVEGGCSVPLDAIADAIKVLCNQNGIIAEGAGACPVAAAMRGMCGTAKKIVCVVCGRGLDTDQLLHILSGKGVPSMNKKSDKKRDKRDDSSDYLSITVRD